MGTPKEQDEQQQEAAQDEADLPVQLGRRRESLRCTVLRIVGAVHLAHRPAKRDDVEESHDVDGVAKICIAPIVCVGPNPAQRDAVSERARNEAQRDPPLGSVANGVRDSRR